MAGSTDNPRIWVDADVYVAPVGSTAPTNATEDLAAAFEAIGLLSEDGMVESREQEETDHYAHGGILVRTTRSKHKRTFTIIALEDNTVVYDLVNPGSDDYDDGTTTTRVVKVPTTPNPKAWVLQLVDGDHTKRRYIPNAEVTAVGDYTMADNAIAAYELTVTVYPSAAGVLYTDFFVDDQAESA